MLRPLSLPPGRSADSGEQGGAEQSISSEKADSGPCLPCLWAPSPARHSHMGPGLANPTSRATLPRARGAGTAAPRAEGHGSRCLGRARSPRGARRSPRGARFLWNRHRPLPICMTRSCSLGRGHIGIHTDTRARPHGGLTAKPRWKFSGCRERGRVGVQRPPRPRGERVAIKGKEPPCGLQWLPTALNVPLQLGEQG